VTGLTDGGRTPIVLRQVWFVVEWWQSTLFKNSIDSPLRGDPRFARSSGIQALAKVLEQLRITSSRLASCSRCLGEDVIIISDNDPG